MKTHHRIFELTALVCGCLASFSAGAYSEVRDGVTIELQNRFSIGAAMRVQGRDPALVGIANGGQMYSNNHDNGDLAFDTGQIYASIAKLTSDLTISKNGFGFYARGSAFFNDALNGKDDFFTRNRPYQPFCDPAPACGKSASTADMQANNNEIQTHNARKIDWLDTYFYGNVPIASRTLSFKIGRQVLNWGESTLILNGINSMVALDANRVRVPGFELSEVFIPTPMVSASMGLTDSSSIEAFYQLVWQRTIVDATSTFFSTDDTIGIGGHRADLSFGQAPENTPSETVNRDGDRKPRNAGQYGVALRSMVSWLNDSEVSLYAMNYHSRLPVASVTTSVTPLAGATLNPIAASSARYFLEYPEDVKLYGASFNSSLPWGLALQGEYSFKDGQPLQFDANELLFAAVGVPNQITGPVPNAAIGNNYVRGWRRHGVSQVDLGLTKIFSPSDWFKWDQVLGLLEVGYMHIHSMESPSTMRYDGPATVLPGDAAIAALLGLPQQQGGYPTPNSWGYNLVLRASYNNVLDTFTLEPTLRFAHDVKGISPKPIYNFVEGRKEVDLSLGFRFRNDITTEVGYATYFGGGKNNLIADRDNVSVTMKYAF